MKQYSLLVKTLLKVQLRGTFGKHRGKKNSVGIWIGFGILYAFVMAMFSLPIATLAPYAKDAGATAEFLTLIMIVGIGLVLFFGIVGMLNTLYFNRDIAFLETLPVGTGTVFTAKLTVLYLYEVVSTALLIFIPMLVAGIASGLGVGFYFALIFALFAIPAFPMLFSCILAIPLMYLVSFFKNRGAIGSIAVLIVFAACMALYFVFVTSLQSGAQGVTDFVEMMRALKEGMRIPGYVFLPAFALGCMAADIGIFGIAGAGAVGVEIACFLGIPLVLSGLAYLLSAKLYRRAVASQQEGRKIAVKASDYRERTTARALFSADFKNVLRTPSFALNFFVGVIIAPLFVLLIGLVFGDMFVSGGEGAEELADMAPKMQLLISSMVVLMLCCSANSAAMTAFSREGKTISVLKTVPVDVLRMVRGKVFLSYGICAVGILLSVIVSLCTIEIDVAFIVSFLIFSLIFAYFTACFGVRADLKSPNFNWTTPNEILKRNRKNNMFMLVLMLATIFVSMFGFGLILFAGKFLPEAAVAVQAIVWTVMIGAAAGLAIWQHIALFRNAQRFWDAIE